MNKEDFQTIRYMNPIERTSIIPNRTLSDLHEQIKNTTEEFQDSKLTVEIQIFPGIYAGSYSAFIVGRKMYQVIP